MSGAATFESTALVEGGLTVLGNASLTSLTVSGPSTFTGATAFNTEATFSAGLISLFGDFLQRVTAVRGFNKRPIVVSAPTASADYAVNDMYLLRPGGSAQTITIVDGNDGDVLEFSVYGDAGTHTATINNPASATLAVLAYTTPTGGRGVSCRIGRIAGTYYVFDIVPFIA